MTGRAKWMAGLALAAFAVMGGCWLREVFLSEETRVRRLLARMADDFNERRARRIRESLAPGFREETSGLNRDEVAVVILQLVQQEMAAGRAGTRLRLEARAEDAEVTVEKDGRRARVSIPFELVEESRGGAATGARSACQAEGGLEKSKEGWRFTSARVKLLSGRWPRG